MNRNDTAPAALAALTSEALVSSLHRSRHDERQCIVEFLFHLAEFDRRELHLELGYPSLFAYLTGAHGFPNGCAFARMTCADLITRYPVAADYLRDGRLCLTTLTALRKVLTPENHQRILDAAASHTEDEVKLLVATLHPREETRDTIRQLSHSAPAPAPTLPSDPTIVPNATAASQPADPSEATTTSAPAFDLRSSAPPPSEPRRPRIEPINAERYSITMHVGHKFMDALKQVRSVLSHTIPDGNLEAVLLTCLETTLEIKNRRKYAALTHRGAREPSRGRTEPSRTSRREVAAAPDGGAEPSRTSRREVAAAPDSALEPSPTSRREVAAAPDGGAEPSRTSRPEVAAAPDSALPSPTSRREVAAAPDLAAESSRTSRREVTAASDRAAEPSRTSRREVVAAAPDGAPEPSRTSRREVAAAPDGAPEPSRTSRREVPQENSRYVAAEERRAVVARDEGMCAWVGPDGKRCCSRDQLEFAHIVSFTSGGPPTRVNIRLLCHRHNAYEARLEFGAEFMSQFTRARRDQVPGK